MSIKLELDAESIKQAISTHIANQGFNLEGKTVEVALINGRGGNGNRATITIHENITKPDNEIKVIEQLEELNMFTAPKVDPQPEVDAFKLPEVEVEETIEMEQGEVIIPSFDPIMAAAEGASNPFGADRTACLPTNARQSN